MQHYTLYWLHSQLCLIHNLSMIIITYDIYIFRSHSSEKNYFSEYSALNRKWGRLWK